MRLRPRRRRGLEPFVISRSPVRLRRVALSEVPASTLESSNALEGGIGNPGRFDVRFDVSPAAERRQRGHDAGAGAASSSLKHRASGLRKMLPEVAELLRRRVLRGEAMPKTLP